MTKILLALALFSVLASPSAQADFYECRGTETTLKFVDYDGQNVDPDGVYVDLFNAQYDRSRVGDIIDSTVLLKIRSVEELEKSKTLKVTGPFGVELNVNFEKRTLTYKTKRSSGSDTFAPCKKTKWMRVAY